MIIEKYKQIKDPCNLVKHFRSKTEFIEWCKMGTKQDLQAALKEFEKDELYEYCAIMREVLNTHYH